MIFPNKYACVDVELEIGQKRQKKEFLFWVSSIFFSLNALEKLCVFIFKGVKKGKKIFLQKRPNRKWDRGSVNYFTMNVNLLPTRHQFNCVQIYLVVCPDYCDRRGDNRWFWNKIAHKECDDIFPQPGKHVNNSK